jgi:hypothetical protein
MKRVTSLFFFDNEIRISNSILDMVENYVLPQLGDNKENRSSFQNFMFCSFLEYQTMTKSKNPTLLSVKHHHYNLLRSTSIFLYTK